MNKIATPSTRIPKYQYKTNYSFINRSNSLVTADHPLTQKKDSRLKNRKESLENSFCTTSELIIEQLRQPLSQFNVNITKNTHGLPQQQKKEVRTLRLKNEELETQISSQAKEIEQLRYALASVKTTVELNAKNIKESQEMTEVNKALRAKYENQAKEMQALQNDIQNLRGFLQASQCLPSAQSSQIDESKISLRAEYAKNYEQVAFPASKMTCEECSKFKEDNEQMKQQYEDELRRLEEENSVMRAKIAKIQALQEEILNKDECIDYLRAQVEKFEKNSKSLLNVIYSLEGMVEKEERPRRLSRAAQMKSIPDQIMTPFTNFRY